MDENTEIELTHLKNVVNQHIGLRPSLPTSSIPHADTGIFIGANRFQSVSGSPDLAARGSSAVPQKMLGWALDAASAEYIGCTFFSSLASFKVTLYLACPNGNAGNIVLGYNLSPIHLTDQIDVAGITDSTTVASPAVTDQMFIAIFTTQNLALADWPVRLTVYRTAADAADTYASDVWFLGALIQ